MLFLHWVYKGCPRKTWNKPSKNNIFRGQPAEHGSATEAENGKWPHNSPSCTIESLISRSLARTHERNETISRLAVSQTDSPPQPPMFFSESARRLDAIIWRQQQTVRGVLLSDMTACGPYHGHSPGLGEEVGYFQSQIHILHAILYMLPTGHIWWLRVCWKQDDFSAPLYDPWRG